MGAPEPGCKPAKGSPLPSGHPPYRYQRQCLEKAILGRVEQVNTLAQNSSRGGCASSLGALWDWGGGGSERPFFPGFLAAFPVANLKLFFPPPPPTIGLVSTGLVASMGPSEQPVLGLSKQCCAQRKGCRWHESPTARLASSSRPAPGKENTSCVRAHSPESLSVLCLGGGRGQLNTSKEQGPTRPCTGAIIKGLLAWAILLRSTAAGFVREPRDGAVWGSRR